MATPLKIWFDDEDVEFMKKYKEGTGISVKLFVNRAIKEYKLKIETEQLIKDLPYNQK